MRKIINLKPVRRIVTANDASGRSYLQSDGPTPASLTVPGRPGYRNMNLWCTTESSSPVDAPDTVTELKTVTPPQGGTILRVIDIPPEPADPIERRRQAALTFSTLFPDAITDDDTSQAPGMHRTNSIDYAILLEGELVAIMDDEETTMHAGDVLIQRGTNHAWANRSSEMARIAFILVDASVR